MFYAANSPGSGCIIPGRREPLGRPGRSRAERVVATLGHWSTHGRSETPVVRLGNGWDLMDNIGHR